MPFIALLVKLWLKMVEHQTNDSLYKTTNTITKLQIQLHEMIKCTNSLSRVEFDIFGFLILY